jgi:hypothetical protein
LARFLICGVVHFGCMDPLLIPDVCTIVAVPHAREKPTNAKKTNDRDSEWKWTQTRTPDTFHHLLAFLCDCLFALACAYDELCPTAKYAHHEKTHIPIRLSLISVHEKSFTVEPFKSIVLNLAIFVGLKIEESKTQNIR